MQTLLSELCPVCGYHLGTLPWKHREPSGIRCPCCGIEFGRDDWEQGEAGDTRALADLYRKWRKNWIINGIKWSDRETPPPASLNLTEQLLGIGYTLRTELCPVCGVYLGFQAWRGGVASDEICQCCGIQFGYHDWEPDDSLGRQAIYANWRLRWVEGGMRWRSKSRKPPDGWNSIEQLRLIGVEL